MFENHLHFAEHIWNWEGRGFTVWEDSDILKNSHYCYYSYRDYSS